MPQFHHLNLSIFPSSSQNNTAPLSAYLFLLLLLQGVGPGLRRLIRAKPEKIGCKHANLLLIFLVLGIFPSCDELREPGRPLEEGDKAETRNQSPSIRHLRRDNAPEPQRKPDTLLDRKIGVPAPRPEARGIETSLQVVFRKALWHLASRLIFSLGILEICFMSMPKSCQVPCVFTTTYPIVVDLQTTPLQ